MSEILKGISVYIMVADVLQSVFWKSVILYQHLFVMFWCIFRGENIGKGSGVWCLMLSV